MISENFKDETESTISSSTSSSTTSSKSNSSFSKSNSNSNSNSNSPNEKTSIVKIKKSNIWSNTNRKTNDTKIKTKNRKKEEDDEKYEEEDDEKYEEKVEKDGVEKYVVEKENKKSKIEITDSRDIREVRVEYRANIKAESRDMMSFKMYVDESENFQEDEKLPDRIEGTYFYDFNILYIDNILLKKFEQDRRNKLISLKNKLAEENLKISGRQNMIDRKNSRKKIKEIEEDIYKYEENIDKNKYIQKARNLLDEYKKIGTISTIISFTSNFKDSEIVSPENEEQQKYRHKIISEYLEISRKYISIDLIRKHPESNSCPNCGISYIEMELLEDDSGNSVCTNCGLEKVNIIKTQFYSDGSRVNNSRNNYEDRTNFEKVLMRYQGKQQNKPSKELYDKLEQYFKSRNLLSSKEYNELPLLPDGTKKGTSREMMFEALSSIGCSGYYDDINLICSVFFGWTLPNVSHLEEQIMKDYDIFQEVYENLDLEGRKSSLNSQWKLYILLKRLGWPCNSKNFKIPTTPSILEYHKIKTKEVYKVLGWDCPF